MSSQQSPSYAGAAKTQIFPTKDQAILIDAIEGAQLKEYIVAIADKVTPAQIRFASRISNNRVCLYLATKTTADNLINNHKTISIRNNTLTIRPLIARNKRIIISNVPPIIPHDDLKRIFESHQVKLASEFTYIKAGINDSPYAHIMSFRRQVYIHPDDIGKLPDSFKIMYDDTTYLVYISPDSSSCFLCKKEGHVAKNCITNNSSSQANPKESSIGAIPKVPPVKALTTSNAVKEVNSVPQTIENLGETSAQAESLALLMEHESAPSTFKRPLSISPPPTQQTEISNITQSVFTEAFPSLPSAPGSQNTHIKRAKKPRAEKDQPDQETALETIEAIINSNPENYPLSSLQFANFFEKARGNKNPLPVVHEFTQDVESVVTMLRQIHKDTTNRGIKSSLTRIVNKLLNSQTCEFTSDLSEVDESLAIEDLAAASPNE